MPAGSLDAMLFRGERSTSCKKPASTFTEVISVPATGSGTPPQGPGGSRKHVDESGLLYKAFKVDRLHLANSKWLEMLGKSLKI
jgi:hypothetical protein